MKLLDHVGVYGAEKLVTYSTLQLCVFIEVTLWSLLKSTSTVQISDLTLLGVSFAAFLLTAVVEIIVTTQAANRDWAEFVANNSMSGSGSRVRSIRWKSLK
jgi:hypothetical protein